MLQNLWLNINEHMMQVAGRGVTLSDNQTAEGEV